MVFAKWNFSVIWIGLEWSGLISCLGCAPRDCDFYWLQISGQGTESLGCHLIMMITVLLYFNHTIGLRSALWCNSFYV